MGLACRPADFSCPVLFCRFSRGTPILAGGIGVARSIVVGFVSCLVLGQIEVSAIAILATGLNAVQRLEPAVWVQAA